MSNIELVTAFVDAWNHLDMTRVESFLAPDVFYHNIPMPPLIGIAAFREAMAQSPFETADWTILNIAEAGNTVLTERIDRFGLPGGLRLSVRVMGAFEIAGSKITAWRDYFDPAEMAPKPQA